MIEEILQVTCHISKQLNDITNLKLLGNFLVSIFSYVTLRPIKVISENVKIQSCHEIDIRWQVW